MSSLRIATFNLNKDEGKFPQRIYKLSNTIYKKHFDILCLQEDYCNKDFSAGKFLNLELDYNYISIKTRQKKRNNILSSSNLTILSKYKAEFVDEIYFHKDKEQERAALFVKIEFEKEQILLINTHLCHLSSINRIEQIKTILEKIKTLCFGTVIICGDLNALPSYNEIKLLYEDGFRDKNNEFTHKDRVILDYIFNKSSKICDIKSEILLKGYSDHYCLLNILKFD